MSTEKNKQSNNIKRFVRPTVRQIAWWSIITPMCAMAIPLLDNKFSLTESIAFGIVVGMVIVVMGASMGMQRIKIDGTTISILSLETMYRWRTVQANEVLSIRLQYPGQSSQYLLIFSLAPHPGRKWTTLHAKKTESLLVRDNIDCPAFVALVDAVRRARPGMTVSNLPPGYQGPLSP